MRLLVMIAMVALASCRTLPEPPPTPPVPPEQSDCESVCARAVEFECSWSQPTKEGATCTEVCTNYQTSGIAAWDIACMMKADSCESMDSC